MRWHGFGVFLMVIQDAENTLSLPGKFGGNIIELSLWKHVSLLFGGLFHVVSVVISSSFLFFFNKNEDLSTGMTE
jgi:hypothetical protein